MDVPQKLITISSVLIGENYIQKSTDQSNCFTILLSCKRKNIFDDS